MNISQRARCIIRSAFLTMNVAQTKKYARASLTTVKLSAFENIIPSPRVLLPQTFGLTIHANYIPATKRKIQEPLSIVPQEIIPINTWNVIDISLPNSYESEIVEPPSNDKQEKKAARLIVIRRAKMKKHKWRKLQKKMKFVFAKKRQKRELKKEKAFQAVLLAQVKEAEKFDAKEYIASRLRIAEWERPITRVRGFYAPDWVIKDHLHNQEFKRKINERIQDCLRLKK